MKKKDFNSAGFTLIELLMVISIVGILTGILIVDFNGVRGRQAVAMDADKSFAMLQDAKAEVKAGKLMDVEVPVDGTPAVTGTVACEGALFTKGESPKFVSAPYFNGGCVMEELLEENYGISSGKSAVFEVNLGSENLDEVYAFFLPPDGRLEFFDSDFNAKTGDAFIVFASSANDDFKARIDLTYSSGDILLSVGDEGSYDNNSNNEE